jgi:hypothetical protein
MLKFFLLILMPLVLLDTILLFVIANKMTDGRCWGVTKKVMKWGLVLSAFAVGGLIVGLIANHQQTVQEPLTALAEALLGLAGFWALFVAIKYGIVRPFLKGLRGH